MCQCSCHDTLCRLARAVITLDAALPHGAQAATDKNDEASPAWCEVFKKTLNTPEGECSALWMTPLPLTDESCSGFRRTGPPDGRPLSYDQRGE